MPVQTRSSRKKAAKGKGQSFSLQTNPFFIEDPISNNPSSSNIPFFYQSLSPTMSRERKEREVAKHDTYNNISTHANDSDSSSSEFEASEPIEVIINSCQKDKDFRKMMKIIMAREKEDYVLNLAKQGAKLPTDYNVETLITKEEETPLALVKKQLQALQTKVIEMKNKDKSSKQYSLDMICLFSFDKNLHMPPFPSRVEIPKFDKYDGNVDLQDHVREFCALCMEFMHEQTYLMHLFLRSLRGQAMEWFSSLPVGIKHFEKLVKLFLQ